MDTNPLHKSLHFLSAVSAPPVANSKALINFNENWMSPLASCLPGAVIAAVSSMYLADA